MDEKRRMRKLKRELKQAGNKRRRRFLKNVAADPDEFDFGRERSEVMNQPPPTDPPGNLPAS